MNIVLSLFIRSMSNAFTDLKKILAEKIPKEQERVAAFRKKYGTTKVGDVTVNMVDDKDCTYKQICRFSE